MNSYIFFTKKQAPIIVEGANLQSAINTPAFSDFLINIEGLTIENLIGYVENELTCFKVSNDAGKIKVQTLDLAGKFTNALFYFV